MSDQAQRTQWALDLFREFTCEWCGWPDGIHDASCERPEKTLVRLEDGLTAVDRAERDFGYE